MNRIEDWAKAIQKHEGFYPGSASYRNNNPGNFRCSSLVMGEFGATNCINNLAVFPTYEKGWAALKQFLIYACTNQLRSYRKTMTLLDFYRIYAPSSDSNNPLNYASSVSKDLGVSIDTTIGSLYNIEEQPIQKNKRYHLFGHMDRNLVRKGDKVIKYATPIGTIGTGNGQYYAHLHFSISENLTSEQLIAYISGWSLAKVQQYYKDPRKIIDFNKMFGISIDVGNFGYNWLQWVGYGYHPGVDINGFGGGNTDIGLPFKSSCDGVVIYEWRGWTKNRGWGNIIIIEEKS